ncbi:alpha/beta fold hydrolase [Pararhodospirillum photometricum]|uniref:alpha/beta fold hydrolase n=1 Tax=Pararhodospirillum photometricum TaxID=1084 RepID=UPI0002D91370|nr:alpha/beta fold hydrolase [Pararhodospirillum photometricum]
MSEPLTLAATRLGHGRPVVILHGLFGRGRNWRAIAGRLQDLASLHLLDARNHGDSPWSDVMTYPALAGDVAAYIEAHGLERPVVIGHSMGGKTAMTLALTRPTLVGALGVIDISPGVSPGRATLDAVIAALQALPVDLPSREAANTLLAPSLPDPALRAFLLQNLGREDGGWRWHLNLPALRAAVPALSGFPDVGDQAAWPGPTLVVRGERSDYVPDSDRDALRRLFPTARVVTVKNAGHWVHAEQPETVVQVLRGFLERG